jgi:sugar O-acyltransferase (sialic acid O-acetyltransferase NeuD family)
MKQILLVGAGGHCKACIDVIEQIGEWQIAGIVDRKDSGVAEVLGYPVIGSDDEVPELRKTYDFAFVTVGQLASPVLKIKLFTMLTKLDFKLPGLVSPLAYVSKHASIGEGTIVMHHAIVNVAAKIGDNCIINTKSLIEHDAVIGDHCHISTSAVINGGVTVGDQTFMGSNATTKQYVSISAKSFIKAGVFVE